MLIPNKKIQDQDLKKAIIANAVGANAYVLSVGDAIQPGATGHVKFVTGAASSGLILGVVVALEYNGKVLELNSVTGVNSTSAVAGQTKVGNDNETTGAWKVVYIPAYVPMEYIADMSAALDTTTDSGGNVFFPLQGVSSTAGTAGTLNEAAPALFGGSATQFVSNGSYEGSTTKVVAHIYKTF